MDDPSFRGMTRAKDLVDLGMQIGLWALGLFAALALHLKILGRELLGALEPLADTLFYRDQAADLAFLVGASLIGARVITLAALSALLGLNAILGRPTPRTGTMRRSRITFEYGVFLVIFLPAYIPHALADLLSGLTRQPDMGFDLSGAGAAIPLTVALAFALLWAVGRIQGGLADGGPGLDATRRVMPLVLMALLVAATLVSHVLATARAATVAQLHVAFGQVRTPQALDKVCVVLVGKTASGVFLSKHGSERPQAAAQTFDMAFVPFDRLGPVFHGVTSGPSLWPTSSALSCLNPDASEIDLLTTGRLPALGSDSRRIPQGAPSIP